MKKSISQKELDQLGVEQNTSIKEDIKNIIILFRNELNILEKEIEDYDNDLQKTIKKKLNSLLNYIISIRKKG